MKNKIWMIICGVLVVLTGVSFYFSGVPYYLRTKKEFNELREQKILDWQFSDQGEISDGDKITMHGVTMCVPKGIEIVSDSIMKYQNDDLNCVLSIQAPEESDDLTAGNGLWGGGGPGSLSDEDLENMVSAVGWDLPASYIDWVQMLRFLQMENCDWHSLSHSMYFYYLAREAQSLNYFGNECYILELPSCTCLVGVILPTEESENYRFQAAICDNDNLNVSTSFILSVSDLEMGYQIINSIEAHLCAELEK
ncbi:MAG: hypothetical protein MJ071_01060 [Oscillospiraceae bacterium]|nr:hypothetical protein [Oscillospiraceae bacterium]